MEFNKVGGMLNVLRLILDRLVGTYLGHLHKPWTKDVAQLSSPKSVFQPNCMQEPPFAV